MNPAATVPLPERMAQLPRDSRGYPIPVVVARDVTTGQPLFIVNDSKVARQCVRKKLCQICGQRMIKELWFIGGPLSALAPNGWYFDSAMHHECAQYALQVCPYLAMTGSRAALREPMLEKISDRLGGTVLVDHTQMPGTPEMMMLVMAYGQQKSASPVPGTSYIRPLRPYHAVEFWREGRQLEFEDGMARLRTIPGLDLTALRLCSRGEV